jgi:hypothetical protein
VKPRPADDLTPVIFRRWRDGTIDALFPTLPADSAGLHCLSYAHIGQHGPADYGYVTRVTRPAKPEEYAELKDELEGRGYKLLVCRRRTPAHREAYKAEYLGLYPKC